MSRNAACFLPLCLVTFLCAALMLPSAAQGVPVAGEVFKLPQPDGAWVTVRIWGDEYYGVTETLDGYTLVRDPNNWYMCYARLNADGTALVSTGVPGHQSPPAGVDLPLHLRITPEAARQQAYAARQRFLVDGHAALGGRAPVRGPSVGTVQGICLIIDFSDDVGTISPITVSNYCNLLGYSGFGNNGSVRDYFYDVSDGYLTYTNYVPPAYYRAAHPKTYYTDPGIPYGTRARELIIEALTYLDDHDFDFSVYDADADGIIDALNCFYAGYSNSNWAEGLWPHAWTVSFCADGVCTDAYQITDMQTSLKLGTFCHENGHMLMGWPDLYDYDYDSTGVGQFCLMCYGTSAVDPCEPCAYMKYIAGWTSTTVLVGPATGLTVPVSSINHFYKCPHPTLPNEYYLIENRQRTGRDVGLPDDGLAIWHIDTEGNNSWQQMTPSQHYLVTLVQADGLWDMENDRNSGDATDLWSAPGYTSCTPYTSPNTNWWDGSASGLHFSNISTSAANMTFDFYLYLDCNGNGVGDDIDIAGGTSQDCNINGLPDECDLSQGLDQDCNANSVPDGCDMTGGTSGDCNINGYLDACEHEGVAGLVGAYYSNTNFTGEQRSRIDAEVNFDWGTGAPLPEIGSDSFSVRWNGLVRTAAVSGTYYFYVRVDDGVRLWVDGELLINRWIDQAPTEWSGNITLSGNSEYPLVMEYYENGGGAVAELYWRPPGQTKVIIPSSNLLPGRDCNGNGFPDTCDTLGGGDYTADGLVTLADYAAFSGCLSGPGLGPAVSDPYCPSTCLDAFDIDLDGDVDLPDFAYLQSILIEYWTTAR